jgi:hypothetical protein
MDEKTRKELERAYELRLMKSATRRRSAPSAASSSSNAAEALKGIATVRQRTAPEKKKTTSDRPKAAAAPAPAAAERRPVAKPVAIAVAQTPGSPRVAASRGLVIGGAAVLCVAGLAAFLWLAPPGGKHSVSGTLMLDNRPLGGVQLFFHPRDRSSDPIRVTTSDGGVFHAEDIPAGDYCVSLAAVDGRVEVPKQYRSEDSTPFRIQLRRDRANLRMVASSRKPK